VEAISLRPSKDTPVLGVIFDTTQARKGEPDTTPDDILDMVKAQALPTHRCLHLSCLDAVNHTTLDCFIERKYERPKGRCVISWNAAFRRLVQHFNQRRLCLLMFVKFFLPHSLSLLHAYFLFLLQQSLSVVALESIFPSWQS